MDYSDYLIEETTFQPKTIRFYLQVSQEWEQYYQLLTPDEQQDPIRLRRQLCRYLMYLDKHYAKSTQNLYRQALNQYFHFLEVELGRLRPTPINLPYLKHDPLPAFVDFSILCRGKLLIDNHLFTPDHEAAMLLSFHHGLMVQEILAIQPTDFDYQKRTLMIRLEPHTRKIYLDEDVQVAIIHYMQWRQEQSYPQGKTFFDRMSAHHIYDSFHQLSKQLQVRLTPCIVRHSLIKNYLENGYNYIVIMKVFGYISCVSIARFERINIRRLQEGYQVFNEFHGRKESAANESKKGSNIYSISAETTHIGRVGGAY